MQQYAVEDCGTTSLLTLRTYYEIKLDACFAGVNVYGIYFIVLKDTRRPVCWDTMDVYLFTIDIVYSNFTYLNHKNKLKTFLNSKLETDEELHFLSPT